MLWLKRKHWLQVTDMDENAQGTKKPPNEAQKLEAGAKVPEPASVSSVTGESLMNQLPLDDLAECLPVIDGTQANTSPTAGDPTRTAGVVGASERHGLYIPPTKSETTFVVRPAPVLPI